MFEKLRQLLATLLIIAILFPGLAYGQASQQSGSSATDQSTPGALATGAHPLGSFGGSSFDQVNLFNGNLSMSFPIAALGGRAGTGAGVSLSYNSKIWQVKQRVVSNQLAADTYYVPEYDQWDKESPILAPGWNFHVGRMMGRRSSWREGQINYTLTTLTFSAPDGTEYSFRDDLTDGQPLTANLIGDNQSRGRRFHTADGTAAIFVSDTEIKDKLQANGPYAPFALDGVVVLRNGARFIISRGKVREQHDTNGNIVRYAYQGTRLTQITDTLGRQINIEYVETTPNPTNEDLFSIKVTSPGFGNSLRTTTIKFAPLANALVGQGGSYNQAETLKTFVNQPGIPNSGLFPELDPPNSRDEFFNPNIIKEIILPSGHKWKFNYNSYGEVVLVETPNLGALEYRMEQSDGPVIAGSPNKQEIFRRITARRLWPKAADRTANLAPESKTTYSDPSLTDSNNVPLPVRQRTFSGENTRIASSRHYYSYSPLQNFGPSTGVPPKTGYSPWMEGKEIKTEELTVDTEQPKRVTEYIWEQRAGVSWIPGADKAFLDQPENDPRIKETTVRYLDSGQVFRTAYEYQDDVFINGVGPFGYNNVISESVFDGTNLLRKNVRTFVTDAEYLKYNDDPNNRDIVINPHFVSLVSTESVLAPNGTEETRVEYEYDNYTRYPLVARTFSITTSHNTNFGTSFTKRGNVTAVTAGLGTSSTQTDRTTGFSQYDIAGNVIKVVGPKTTQIATTDYDPQHFAFPIASHQTIPEFPQEFKTESTYDVSTGLVISSKDLNNQAVNYFYQDPDLLDRITKVVRPTGSGETNYSYSSPGIYPAWVKVESSLDSSRNLSAISYVDGFLKPIKQTSQDVNNDFVSVETEYDGLSRGVKTINPHRLSIPSTTTDGYTKTTYDELGRISTVNTFDGNNNSTGIVTSTYSGTTITVTDQANKQRRSTVDALGRLIEVLEPTSTGALTQSTTYDYDARGNLKQVHQGEQTRTFNYDSLGRLVSSITPETGAIGNGFTSYEYDIASNLTKRTDPRNIVTTYTYDTLNRLLTRSYSDSTPTATYFYDGNLPANLAPPGFIPQFAMGRTTAVVTQTTTREQATGLFHTYDNVGRIPQSIQLLDGQYYITNNQYNLASLPTNHTYPSGRNVSHDYNIAGQLTDVMTNGQPISGQATYTAAGAIASHQLGNGLYHQMKYNSRLQPTEITLGSDLTGQAAEDKWKQEYDYGVYPAQTLSNTATQPTISTNQAQNNGNIGHIKLTPGNGQNPISQFFAYDELNRLKVAKEFAIPFACDFPLTFVSQSGNATIDNGNINFSSNGQEQAQGDVTYTVDLTNVSSEQKIHLVAQATFSSTGLSDLNGGGVGVSIGNRGVGLSSQDINPSPNQTFSTPLIPGIVNTVVLQFGSSAFAFSNGTLPSFSSQVAISSLKIVCGQSEPTLIAINGRDDCQGTGINTVTVTDPDDPVNGLMNITVSLAKTDDRIPEIIGIIPDTITGTGSFSFSVSTCAKIGITATKTNGLTSSESFVNFSRASKPKIPDAETSQSTSEPTPLVDATVSWSQEYIYDRFGNRTQVQGTNAQNLNISTTNNRLTGSGYTYDPAGNLKSEPNGRFYFYDAENRLIKASSDQAGNDIIAQYFYDASGQRIKKVTQSSTTRFVYNQSGTLLAEYEGEPVPAIDSPTKENIYAPSGLLAVIEANQTYYLTPDHLGSPRIITDSIGAISSRRDFYPFGESIDDPSIGGRNLIPGYFPSPDSIRQKFTGYEKDTETNLDFAQARHFASKLGRFMQTDPFGASGVVTTPQTWNRYSYTLNDPINFKDPTGLFILQKKEASQPVRNIIIFYAFRGDKDRKRTYTFNGKPGAYPKVNFETLASRLERKNPNVNITVYDVEGTDAPTVQAFKDALARKDVFAIIFVGHGVAVGEVYKGVLLADQEFRSPVEVSAQNVFLFSCGSSSPSVQELFQFNNPDNSSSLVGVDSSGTDKNVSAIDRSLNSRSTSTGALIDAGVAALEVLAGKKPNINNAVQAANNAFTPPALSSQIDPSKKIPVSRDPKDVGDKVIKLR